jgi:excisionase family DNA binding protein
MHQAAAMQRPPSELLSTTQVCERLGIDRSTLTRWVGAGRIAAAHKLPGRSGAYLFDPAEVERVKAELSAGVA